MNDTLSWFASLSLAGVVILSLSGGTILVAICEAKDAIWPPPSGRDHYLNRVLWCLGIMLAWGTLWLVALATG